MRCDLQYLHPPHARRTHGSETENPGTSQGRPFLAAAAEFLFGVEDQDNLLG